MAEVVTYDGDKLYGAIAFDKDEIWDLEFIDGNDGNIKYQVPVRNIKMIKPKNSDYSLVVLKNGEQLFLGDSQDVSDSNDGILVFVDGNDEPFYVDWDEVDVIHFK